MLRKLLLAAVVALVVGPGFAFHRLGCMDLSAPRMPVGLALEGIASLGVEPLLPSGHF